MKRSEKSGKGAVYEIGLKVMKTGASSGAAPWLTVILPPGGAIFTAPPPPASPGPVAALPALSVSPFGTVRSPGDRMPRLMALMGLPLVIVMAPFMFMSPPAQNKAFPSVIVMAPFVVIFRPALNKRLPLVIVSAAVAAKVIFCPQHTTRFPWVAVIEELILTLPAAFNVSVVLAPPRVHSNVAGPASKVMFPGAVPVLVVVIVTSVPAVRSTMSSAALILDVFAPAAGE